MTRARVQLEPGYILNARPYNDTSLLVEAFTREHGRIGFVARGARGPKSKTRALLQPLQPLLLSWTQSGELGGLTAVEAAGPSLPISGERVFYGWYVNELILKLLQRQDPHPSLFETYALTLTQLADSDAERALRIFEKRLLDELGYGLQLPDDLEPELHYQYDWAEGPIPTVQGPSTFLGAHLIALAQETLDSSEAQSHARRLLKAAIQNQLGGKTLETPVMLRQLRSSLRVK
ncbi:DNA repair protein RecO [Stenotrophobium rhamnosiphilum]|uniref:DNA repair protein RecO n=1 Tax=Stenotrophobium rhamnosiphilum TaxID=2029166 RepID=A0A2T5MKP7_9GAMM|nr:DNA repair protein RecO [Stenotrophobium rhamnosiphilum]PTU33140.1 DNA repair protein RecO [Stenotrophobium rhamnosiphilum]